VSVALDRSRILVADDQPDVARTLCMPLRRAGAMLTFVSDGRKAFSQLGVEPFDLVILDMKMPPGEWGGLWLLSKLRDDQWKIPVLVLSGEGTKTQTIEALRLGASDWIDKSEASSELQAHCQKLLEQAFSEGLDRAAFRLPTALAHRLVAYARSIDTERHSGEGHLALEAVLKLAAIFDMCSASARRLLSVTPTRMITPSMGTWFTACTELARILGDHRTSLSLAACLMPDSTTRSQVQEQVHIRNAAVHTGYTPTGDEEQRLNGLLTRFSHRASSCWRSSLAVPVSMGYDGTTITVTVLALVGTALPKRETRTITEKVRTGQPILMHPDSSPVYLSPWVVRIGKVTPQQMQCLIFDGVNIRGKGQFQPDSPLTYINTETSARGIQVTDPAGLVWSAISPWFSNNPPNTP
jgi:CheY-like chemotaxis protein